MTAKLYLTVDDDPDGDGMIAILTQGHPNRGDEEVIVCNVKRVQTRDEADAWFKRQCVERPWEVRS